MKTTNFAAKRGTWASISLLTLMLITGCGGGGGGGSSSGSTGGTDDAGIPSLTPPDAPELVLDVEQTKIFRFSWSSVDGATDYTLLENPDGQSGFTEVASLDEQATGYAHTVFLPTRVNASYMLEACNSAGCTASTSVPATGNLVEAVGYFKASNSGEGDFFGVSMAMSADGSTLAVAANNESSNATGIDGDQTNDDLDSNGAVYVFVRGQDGEWVQQAYIKPSVARSFAYFGISTTLSADGSTLAVGTNNGNRAFIFTRDGETWSEHTVLQAPGSVNIGFGRSVSLSGDGITLAVGVSRGGSPDSQGSMYGSGEVHIYTLDGENWAEQAVLAPFRDMQDEDQFGWVVALSENGDYLAVGAPRQDSDAVGVNGNATGFLSDSGAVYTFSRDGNAWLIGVVIKASNTGANDRFGHSAALSADGRTLVVGAHQESGDGDAAEASGAVYIFDRDAAGGWAQQSYLKASGGQAYDRFGYSVAISADGETVAVGANEERGSGIGVNATDDYAFNSGAAYLFKRNGGAWTEQAYIKASNTGMNDRFGNAVALAGDGETLAVGASMEDSGATGINGDQQDDSVDQAGAVYLY